MKEKRKRVTYAQEAIRSGKEKPSREKEGRPERLEGNPSQMKTERERDSLMREAEASFPALL